MTQFDAIGTTLATQKAYEDLEGALGKIQDRKKQLIDEIEGLQIKEAQIVAAMDGLAPFITFNMKSIDTPKKLTPNPNGVQYGIKWKSTSLDILKKNRGQKYSSSELFDLIHPEAKTIDSEARRRAMVNLAIALRELSDAKEIKSQKKDIGKGKMYWTE